MAISLLDLPPELLVRVASYLTTPELGPLRRSCKQIENYLFDSFAQEFFTKRQFMIEHESLEALTGIANHTGLAAKLTEVIIGTQAFHMHMHADIMTDIMTRRFIAGHVTRDVLLQTGQARDMLADIFSRLPNLRTVGLRDYDGAGRHRDGAGARWRSWGWSLYDVTYLTPPAVTFSLILSALGAANAKPTNIEVFLRRQPQLFHTSFELSNSSIRDGTISSLGNLRTLMLAITLEPQGATIFQGEPWNTSGKENIVESSLRRFLHYTCNLEALRLNFQPDQFFAPRLLEWLGKSAQSSPPSSQLRSLPIPPVPLNSLTSLELGMANVPGPVLLRALARFDLKLFSLWKMILQCPGPNSISKDCWAEFLEQLSTILPSSSRIRTVMIGHVSQCQFSHGPVYLNGPKVSFVDEGTNSADKAKAKKLDSVKFEAQYIAKTVHQWLKELSERTFIPGIHTTPTPADSDGEISGSEEDDDEGDEEAVYLTEEHDDENNE